MAKPDVKLKEKFGPFRPEDAAAVRGGAYPKTRDISKALTEAWYELMFDMTRSPKGRQPKIRNQKERRENNTWGAPKFLTHAGGSHFRAKLTINKKDVFPYGFVAGKNNGWKGRCWQFAAKLIQLTNIILKENYGYDNLSPLKLTAAKGKRGFLPTYPPSRRTPKMKYGYGNWLDLVYDREGDLFGAGSTLQQLGRLGIVPGMVVHVCMDWDAKHPRFLKPLNGKAGDGSGGGWYARGDSFHHWLVYVGEKRGIHYYADSRGIKSARLYDNWLRNSWVWNKFRGYDSYKKNKKGKKVRRFKSLREYMAGKYGLKSNHTIDDIEKKDYFSATALVRWVATPWSI